MEECGELWMEEECGGLRIDEGGGLRMKQEVRGL